MISIIIPSYNSAHFIKSAVDSILLSDLSNKLYEVIVVNDGSSDNIVEVIEGYNKYDNIILVNQLNKGLAGARNTGIKQAKGKYLVFLDADDIILPNKLSKQLEYLDSNLDIDIVYSDSVFFEDKSKNEFKTYFPHYEGSILKNLLYGNFIHVNSTMARKNKVTEAGCFDKEFRELEDWDLWLRMSLNGSKFVYIDKVLSKVRVHSNSMTSNQKKMNKAMLKTLIKFESFLFKSSSIDNYKLDLYKAINLYAIKSRDDKFWMYNNKALSHLGFSFIRFYIKNILKWYLLKMNIISDKKSTEELERVWNNG